MFLEILASIILMGSPGSGKSSFAEEYLHRHPDAVHFSVGDWIRDEIAKNTPLGKRIKEELAKDSFVKNGYLLDDAFIEEIVQKKLQELIQAGKFFVLDGFPRNLAQAEFLETIITDADIVYLVIDPEVAKSRMEKRGREYDTKEMIEGRLSTFKSVTIPAIYYYRDKGLLIEIDASYPPEETVDVYEKMLRN